MQTQTMTINETTHQLLLRLAEMEKTSADVVLDRALETYQRELFWKQTNEAYAELKTKPEAWAEELAERTLWEQTLADGVETE